MSRIVGIDLGTTFSAVCLVREGLPCILPNGQERIVPSVVGFSPEGKLLVGTPARNQYALYPESTVRSIKRKMGTQEMIRIQDKDFRPEEISALILKEMKRIAQSQLGEGIDRVVITVPAFFDDGARQATKQAGELAGFTVERIINEPTAAALAYGLDQAQEQQLVAVYDLGGGTFDVSIIELNQGVIEVRASHGDTHLGGDDFDALLMDWLAEQFLQAHKVDLKHDIKAMARLSRAAETAKIELSSKPIVTIREEYLLEHQGRPLHLEAEISRVKFETMIRPFLERTLICLDEALLDAKLKAEDLDKVIFVGGSTRIPLVWEMVARHTGREPLVEINPDEAVALGAGIQAAIIEGEPIDAILVDVTPHSLGIEVADIEFGMPVPDRYQRIIHRNSTLPICRSELFHALLPSQTEIHVKIYQGEEPIASRNTLLGDFLFSGLKPEKPGIPPAIVVEYDLDLNGILKVCAKDRGSKKIEQTTVHAAHTRLSPKDQSASARYLDEVWSESMEDSEPMPTELVAPREDDAPVLAKARAFLAEEGGWDTLLVDLVKRVDQAKAEGRQEATAELLNHLVDVLYEYETDETEEKA